MVILGNFKRPVCHYERTLIKALLVEGIHVTVELFLIGLFWLRMQPEEETHYS